MKDSTKYRDFGDLVVEIEDSGIVKYVLKSGADIGVELVRPVNEWLHETNHPKPWYILTIFEYGVTIDAEARDYGSSPDRAGQTAADAVVMKTLAHKIIINFYLKYNKPDHPTRAFSSEEKAREWLFEMMEKGKSQNP